MWIQPASSRSPTSKELKVRPNPPLSIWSVLSILSGYIWKERLRSRSRRCCYLRGQIRAPYSTRYQPFHRGSRIFQAWTSCFPKSFPEAWNGLPYSNVDHNLQFYQQDAPKFPWPTIVIRHLARPSLLSRHDWIRPCSRIWASLLVKSACSLPCSPWRRCSRELCILRGPLSAAYEDCFILGKGRPFQGLERNASTEFRNQRSPVSDLQSRTLLSRRDWESRQRCQRWGVGRQPACTSGSPRSLTSLFGAPGWQWPSTQLLNIRRQDLLVVTRSHRLSHISLAVQFRTYGRSWWSVQMHFPSHLQA